MAAGQKIKLFQIASEINIGKDAVVEFLQSKGFDIQNKPIAVLNSDMVDAVYEKFKREKRAAEIQRDKIEKHKKIRRTSDKLEIEKPATIKIESEIDVEKSTQISLKKSSEKKKESETLIIDSVTEPDIVEEKKVVKVEIPDIDENLKVDDKVQKEISKVSHDLDKSLTEKQKIPEIQKAEKIKDQREQVESKEPVSDKKSATEIDISAKHVEKERTKKPDIDKVLQQIADRLDKRIEAQEKETEKAEDDSTKDGKLTADGHAAEESEESKEAKKSRSRRRRKRKKVIEVELEDGKAPQLRGLTIVGKIDLAKEKEIEKPGQKGIIKVIKKDIDDDDSLIDKKAKVRKKKGIVKTDKRKKKKVSVRELITEEDIDKAIKSTISEMSESSGMSQRSRMRHRKKVEREEKEQRKLEEQEIESKILRITEFVTTGALAELMHVSPNEIILKCLELGLMVTLNQRLDKDTITLISDDYGIQVEFLDEKAAQLIVDDEIDDKLEDLTPRSPIVTVMGHVDHGKTSLLDFIRKTRVVAGEAGGITQHIGAYRVEIGEKAITFLDTPGHEAFTAMRARGAQVTDIVVLVVAADDSVMPQTIEAISHAQAANVPIVVAINKIDKPDANPDRIRQQLTDHNILVEDWGGKNQCVEISAKKGTNVELLLEKILLEAELLDLKANPLRRSRATVVEANMDKGLGTVATIIVQKGTLKVGDSFVAGISAGRVRTMFDERNNKVERAGPSIPVRLIGFDNLPEAGDILLGVESDIEARIIANERQSLKREQEFRQIHHMTLDDISKQILIGGVKDLYLIIKGDVSGSVEALSDSLQKQSTEEVRVIILHKGVGSISESDVMLAVASKAVIIGFQVSPSANARKLAEKERVDIRLYNIIYDAINEVRLALEGLLSPELREEITSSVEVRMIFKISKLGYIAGCYVKDGKIHRNDRVRVLRDGLPVYNGTLHSLKREKDDTKEVETGYECGIMLSGFNDVEVGDIIQSYKLLEIKRTL